MYGMVLMAAMTGTGDAASFGHKSGCTGEVVSSGCTGHKLFGGGCHGGMFGLRHKHEHGCHGSSCTGYVPAPVYVAPAPVVAPAPCCAPVEPACCPAPKKHCKLFGGMKHKSTCCAPISYVAPCATPGAAPAVTVPPSTPTPMPADKKPVDKKPGD
jgi:hypothetical protein